MTCCEVDYLNVLRIFPGIYIYKNLANAFASHLLTK
jgi:hypothetical protein